jgi:hypothetical protein
MKCLKKLIFTVLTVIFMIFCLELIGFTVLKLKDHDKGIDATSIHRFSQYRNFELNPNYRGRKLRTAGQKTHSSDGFRRNSSISIEKPSNVIRIFYMGGSQLYGSNASTMSGFPFHRDLLNSEGIDKISEDLLNKKLKNSNIEFKAEVINAGVVSYQTFQHLFYIMEKIYQYSPDFIVCLDGHNDFYIADPTHNHLLDSSGLMESNLADNLNKRSFMFALYVMVRSLSQYSYFLSSMERLLHQSIVFGWAAAQDNLINQQPLSQPSQSLKKEKNTTLANLFSQYPIYAKNTFLRSYKLIQQLGKHYGFKTLVFLQPEVVFENVNNLGAKDLNIREITIQQYDSLKQANARINYDLKVRSAIREMLPDLFHEYDIPFHDIAELASPEEPKTQLYIDYTHLTPEGARRTGTKMANKIFAHIQQKLQNDNEKINAVNTEPEPHEK